MARLILSFSLALFLCIYCSIANASNSVDAFSAMSSDLPVPIDPAMRTFLRDKAIKLKNEWHEDSLSPSLLVIATFGTDSNKAWHVDSLQSQVYLWIMRLLKPKQLQL